MLRRLGRFAVRRRKAVLAGTATFVVLAAVFGGGVADRLVSGGFEDPDAESTRAADAVEREFGEQDPDLILLVTAKGGTVDGAEVTDRGRALTDEVAGEPGVGEVASYWSLGGVAPLRSEDGTRALVLGVLEGDDDQVDEAIEGLSERYTRDDRAIRVEVGGFAEVFRQVNEQIEQDALRAELIAIPITLGLLVVVFGSLVAAGLPIAVGIVSIIGTFLVLLGVSSFTDVSIYALNMTTALGLGLAIDYSLFIVSRYREELGHGLRPHDAVVRSVETAGRTIAFSAVTVAVSLAALLVFPLGFLRSFGYAGIAVAILAATASILSLPALLAVLGPRVDSLTLWRRHPKPVGEGFWHRMATVVMRRPLPIALVVTAALVLLGLPFLHLRLGLPDDRVLPEGISSRKVHEAIREDFASNEANALQVVATGIDPDERAAELVGYAADLSRLDGVARVDALSGSYVDGQELPVPEALTRRFAARDATWLSVVPAVEPLSAAGERLAQDVRDVDGPFDVLVGGGPAELVDAKDTLRERVPLAAGLIALATFVLLFLMFGSILVPVKALVLNVLSLTATFGAMVWVFQDGHLAGLLGFTPTGSIVASMPLLMFCIAFGLSMDYEVFLLSRIKEEYDRTGDNTRSVAIGLERTGRIVTAAALLISVVMIAFGTASIAFMKLFGLGLTLAVLVDAFVIRGTLVPAFMRLAGRANWWAPGPLRRFHDRFGIGEHQAPPASSPPAGPPADDRVSEPVGSR
ncbi:MAG: MMPL family transporter [Acidimicrobiia bacterium]